MNTTLAIALLAAVAGAPKEQHVKPLPAPSVFASFQYAVTFNVPEHTSYCPLPNDWEGSDHGTVIFLEPPAACYGAGYPSSGRGFEPLATPRIEVFYAYCTDDSCNATRNTRLFTSKPQLKTTTSDGLSVTTVQALYLADIPAEIDISLVTTPKDKSKYLGSFLALVASVRTCKATWFDSNKPKKPNYIGHGTPCEKGQWF